MSGMVEEISRHWVIDLSIPVVAAVIGYVTKLVAIQMMFQPLEFFGVKPWFGWQGIVPRRVARMASIATDTMTTNLIDAADVLARLDAHRIAQELDAPIAAILDDLIADIAEDIRPGLWRSLPPQARELLLSRVRSQVPELIENFLTGIETDVEMYFDLKDMVVGRLVHNKPLVNRIFQEAGSKEFRFIARSGIYFGFAIGLIQMTIWAIFHQPLAMPAFGLAIGWFTDWLALKMIFNPKRPIRVPLTGFHLQGLFLKRRNEVAADYAALIAEEIITARHVIEALLNGPMSDRLIALMRREVQHAFERQLGLAQPVVSAALGTARYQRMKTGVTTKVMDQLPETLYLIEGYAHDAMDIRHLLTTKMQELTAEQFESLLRPAFQQDEWMLITVGAVLGFVMGEAQALILEHLAR